jgi:ribosomal protein S18 acetylase RimI-like enzyme
LFSVLMSDPHIWGVDEQGDALYLHRIVTNLAFRGQRTFETVLLWAQEYARANGKRFIRMDTWAQNTQIIRYYQSYGFTLKRMHVTGDVPELPAQNRNLHVALLELKVAR